MTLAEYRKRGGLEAARDEEHAGEAVHAEKHPGPLEYAQIGSILALITGVEVVIYYLGLSHTLLVVFLLVLSATKFSMVVLWFMHLKFDNRIFSTMFILGFILALSVFTVALATVGGKLV
jgi:cytochrome c oxidase subunit IV